MPFDQYYQDLFAELADVDLNRLDDPGVWPRVIEAVERLPDWECPPVRVEDRVVPGPHGAVPARVYRPPHGSVSGALLWAHGGGFTGGDLDMRESHMVGAELAHRSGCAVVSVGYRLASPTVRYPVPVDDVDAAWRWMLGEFGSVDCFLGGNSAGAALALSVAMRSRSRGLDAAGILLACPLVHFPVPPPVGRLARAIADLPDPARLPPAYVARIVRDYVGRDTDVPADAMPGGGSMFGLPPVAIVTAEFDGLRPAAELLVSQLEAAGVPVRTYVAPGMLHGHLNLAPSIPAVGASLDFLARALSRGT